MYIHIIWPSSLFYICHTLQQTNLDCQLSSVQNPLLSLAQFMDDDNPQQKRIDLSSIIPCCVIHQQLIVSVIYHIKITFFVHGINK